MAAETSSSSGGDPVGMVATIGLDMFEGWLDFSSEKKQAKISRKTLAEQIKLYQEQKQKLASAYDQKQRLISGIYGRRIQETEGIFETKTKAFQSEGEELSRGIEDQKARTGLAFSGTAEEKGEFATEKFKLGAESAHLQFSSSLNQLRDTLSSAKFQTRMERDKVFSDLDITIAGLKGKKKQARAKEKEKFLGIF